MNDKIEENQNIEEEEDEEDFNYFPQSLSLEQMKCFQEQMERSICKIKCNDKGNGTGFFCNIPFPDKINLLPVLITNNHVIEKKDLTEGKKIKISLNNGRVSYSISIDKDRKIYTNEIPYDITIIEIKQSDKFENVTFLDIDEEVYKDKPNEIYKKKSIYLLHYPYGFNAEYSLGTIINLDENDGNIEHSCQSNNGSSGSPLINSCNYKVMGIHKGRKEEEDWNVGTFIKTPIEKFFEANKLI